MIKTIVIAALSAEEILELYSESENSAFRLSESDKRFLQAVKSNPMVYFWHEICWKVLEENFEEISKIGELVYVEENDTYYERGTYERIYGSKSGKLWS